MNRILICLVALIVAASGARSEQEVALPPIGPVLERMLVSYIRPGYDEVNIAASDLETSLAELCATPSGEHLEAARSGFRATVDRWSRMEWLRIGPVMSENRLERILFFPDRKGTGRKQVQAAIASRNESVIKVETLSSQSVAMQGLGALEFILWQRQRPTGRCGSIAPLCLCPCYRRQSGQSVPGAHRRMAGWRRVDSGVSCTCGVKSPVQNRC